MYVLTAHALKKLDSDLISSWCALSPEQFVMHIVTDVVDLINHVSTYNARVLVLSYLAKCFYRCTSSQRKNSSSVQLMTRI